MKHRRKAANRFVIQFLKTNASSSSAATDDLVEKWKAEENQRQFRTACLPKTGLSAADKEKYYSCYILYGFDNRDRLRQAHPTLTMVEITCLLAKYWRIHKEANDATYRHYKALFEQMAFARKHKPGLIERYPEKTAEDIDRLVLKMYAKWHATSC